MQADVVIIGSGIGGATLAAALAPTGKRIVVLERGAALQNGPNDRDAKAIFGDGVFRPDETWLDGADQPFSPGNYYYVGGNSKFYGAVMLRYREADFRPIVHHGGTTPGWPISYAELAPFYDDAEALFRVHGAVGEDPTEPTRTRGYPDGAVPDEADVTDLREPAKPSVRTVARIAAFGCGCAEMARGWANHLGCLSQHLRWQE